MLNATPRGIDTVRYGRSPHYTCITDFSSLQYLPDYNFVCCELHVLFQIKKRPVLTNRFWYVSVVFTFSTEKQLLGPKKQFKSIRSCANRRGPLTHHRTPNDPSRNVRQSSFSELTMQSESSFGADKGQFWLPMQII